MSANRRLVLIPRPTRLEGREDVLTTFRTPPLDVSHLGAAQIEVGRGPIQTADPCGGRFETFLEESPDGKTWSCSPGGIGHQDPRGEVTEVFLRTLRYPWLRARVEFQGRSVTCWAEGEAFP